MSKYRGFSAIEVLIASGLLALVMMGLMNVFNINLRSQRTIEQGYARSNLAEEIRAFLSDTRSCTVSFQGLTPATRPPATRIVQSVPNPATPGTFNDIERYNLTDRKSYDGKLQINTMTVGPYSGPGGPTNGLATLNITLKRIGEAMGPTDIVSNVHLSVSLDAAGAITSCTALSNMTDGIWSKIVGTSTDVEYMGGMVNVNSLNIIVPAGGRNYYSSVPAPCLNTGGCGQALLIADYDKQAAIRIAGRGDRSTYSALYLASDPVASPYPAASPALPRSGTREWVLAYKDVNPANLSSVGDAPAIAGSLVIQQRGGAPTGYSLSIFPNGEVLTKNHLIDGTIQGANILGTLTYVPLTVSGDIVIVADGKGSGPGNVTSNGNYSGVAFFASSDRRLKENIQPLKGMLEKVMRLQPVSYFMKADQEKKNNIGFIAQDLEKEFPEFVATNKDGMKSVSYGNMSAVLAQALREMKTDYDARLKTIDQRVRDLEAENKSLKAKLEGRK